jgi:hypothetical protein
MKKLRRTVFIVIENVPRISTVMTKYDCSGSIGERIGSAIRPNDSLIPGFKISSVISIITTNIIPIEPPGGDGGAGLELPDIIDGRSIKGMKVSINYALN